MAKLTTSDLTSLTSNEASAVSTINNNFAAVETAMENTLSRDGTTPNTMEADIDLNSNDLLNVGTLNAATILVDGLPVLSEVPDLDELGDVTITAAASGDLLRWNGTIWANYASSNFAAASHSHAISDVTNLQTTLDGKASSSHTHAIADVTNLQTTLDGKADDAHTHVAADVTDFEEAVEDVIGTAIVAGTNVTVTYNDGAGTVTIDATGGEGGASAINDLTDVTISGAAEGDILRYNGSAWVNQPFRGCMVKKSADQTSANYTAGVAIAWDSEIYDEGGWHDNVTNNTRLTVPSGVTRIRLHATVRLANVSTNVSCGLWFAKNGNAAFDGSAANLSEISYTTPMVAVSSGVIPVVAGDYFEVYLLMETDTSIDIQANRSNFSIEAVT